MRKVTKSGVSFMAVVVSLAASGSGRAGEPNSPSPGAGTEAHAPAAASARAYGAAIARLASRRGRLAARYARAADAARRDGIIAEARRLVEDAMSEEILPAWLGTPWSFNGVSRRPGAGSIACGSFVVFTLQDAAFRIPSRMLRQPSENIIKNLVPAGGIRRYAMQRPAFEVVRDIREQGDGLYMVGLDVHVGFLVNRGGDVAFWHSTYFPRGR